MNSLKILFVTFSLYFLSIESAFSGSRYWIGGAGNWTTTSHWAASSGGTTDNILPTSTDDIYIDANSGAGTITTSSAITVASINFQSGCSSITLDVTSNTLTVNNDIWQNSGATNGTIRTSGGTLTVKGNINVNAGTFQANSGTVNINGTYFFIAGGTSNFAGATINVGNSTDEYIRLYSGTLTISTSTVNVTNYIYVDNNGLNISGGIINIGTGMACNYIPLYVAGSGTISGGTINIQSVQSNGYATYISSACTFTGGLMKITATNGNYYIYSQTSYNLEINSPGVTAYFASNGTFGGDFTLTNGTADLSGSTIITTGQTYLNGGTFQASYGTYTCNGSGVAFSISGATANFAGATINVGNSTDEAMRMYSGAINVSDGTVNIKNYFLTDVAGFSISGGTMNIGTGGAVTYEAFYMFGNGTFSGGTINVQSVQSGGSGIAYDISSGSTFTGGLMKVTATNANYNLWTRNAYNLEINSPSTTATLASSMNIKGDLTVTSGTLTASTGTTTFNGTVAQNILGTSATAITLYNVTLNNSNGLTIAPSSGIATTVKYTLTLTSGKITLGNYTLNIGTTGISGSISGGNSSNYIITNGTGILKQFNVGTGQRTSVFYPIGNSSSSYTPITLAVSGSSTVDDFGIRVDQNEWTNGTSGSTYTNHAVDRTWYISEGTTGGSSVTIAPQWNASNELSGFSRSSAFVKHYYSGMWNYVASGSTTGSNPYTITSGAITSFSPFAIFDAIALPISLIEFTAEPISRQVEVNWNTATEENVDYFVVRKTTDGMHFQSIGTMNSMGNPSSGHQYVMNDLNPFSGISYYQLETHDINGNISYSDLRSVLFSNNESSISIYPNPVINGEFNLISDKLSDEVEISIIDNSGKLVHFEIRKATNNGIIQLNLGQNIASGLYHIHVSSQNLNEIILVNFR